MTTETYSNKKVKQLFVESPFDEKTGQKEYKSSKNYLEGHFFAVSSGDWLIKSGADIKTVSQETFTKVYLNRLPKQLKSHMLSETVVYDQVCVPNQQFIQGDQVNIMPPFKHTNDMKYKKCTASQKAGVEMMLGLIRDVWASGVDESFDFIMKWISNMVRGNKNKSLLYLKSVTEGIGKSTVSQFIQDYVIGPALSIESNSDPLKTKYNKILFGKLFVVFEELEKASANEWESISSKLKSWITSDKIVFENKFENSFESHNISNYIVLSNRDCIKHSNGRRYFTLDLSTKYLNNTKYWDTLHKTCFNDSIGKAFYLYLMDIDLTGFNSAHFPILQAKTESISERLHPLFKMIKFNWVIPAKPLQCSVKELYDHWTDYAVKINTKMTVTKHNMTALLREIGINYITSNSKTKFNIPLTDLKAIATKFKWYSEHDNDELDENSIFEDITGDKFSWVSDKEHNALIKRVKELEAQLRLCKPLKKIQKKPVKTTTIDPDDALVLDFDKI